MWVCVYVCESMCICVEDRGQGLCWAFSWTVLQLIFISHVWVFCLHVCIPCLHSWCPQRSEEDGGPLKLDWQKVVSCYMGTDNWLSHLSKLITFIFLRQGFSPNLEHMNLSRLDWQQVPGIFPISGSSGLELPVCTALPSFYVSVRNYTGSQARTARALLSGATPQHRTHHISLILQVVNIREVSNLDLLWLILPQPSIHKSLCGHVFSSCAY